MELSARNRLTGEVASIEREEPVAEVVVDLPGGEKVTSIVTTQSVKRLGLTVGEPVDVVVKATDVMVSTEATDETTGDVETETASETTASPGGPELDDGPSSQETDKITDTGQGSDDDTVGDVNPIGDERRKD
jgi:molybdopterin-binding protein